MAKLADAVTSDAPTSRWQILFDSFIVGYQAAGKSLANPVCTRHLSIWSCLTMPDRASVIVLAIKTLPLGLAGDDRCEQFVNLLDPTIQGQEFLR